MKYLDKVIRFWKAIWGKLIAFIICGSIVALFIASFCLKEELTLSVMNEWVSLVVGMAALILGIISLFLSFYNVEQSNNVQRETIEIMHGVKDELSNRIGELEKKLDSGFGSNISEQKKINFQLTSVAKTEKEEGNKDV